MLIQSVQMGTLADAARSLTHETFLRPAPPPVAAGSTDPDIYLVLLDGHTRSDVMGDVFGSDESAFIGALEADGFKVAHASRSNYTNTSETLSSMFSATHLRDMPSMAGLIAGTEARPAGGVVREAINDNATLDLLHGRGYEVEAIVVGLGAGHDARGRPVHGHAARSTSSRSGSCADRSSGTRSSRWRRTS